MEYEPEFVSVPTPLPTALPNCARWIKNIGTNKLGFHLLSCTVLVLLFVSSSVGCLAGVCPTVKSWRQFVQCNAALTWQLSYCGGLTETNHHLQVTLTCQPAARSTSRGKPERRASNLTQIGHSLAGQARYERHTNEIYAACYKVVGSNSTAANILIWMFNLGIAYGAKVSTLVLDCLTKPYAIFIIFFSMYIFIIFLV